MKRPLIKNNRIGRFAVVGVANTAVDFILLIVLKSLGLPAVGANIISSTTAFMFSFVANKKYTFKTTGTNLVREMILFVIVTLTGLWLFQSAIIHVTYDPLTHILNNNATLGLVASKLLATAVSMTWNYLMYSWLVFIKH